MGAQIRLNGERKLREILKRGQIIRVHPGFLELLGVEGRVGVGVGQSSLQSGELQAGDLVA
jgi:hypothetical protein